MTETQAAAGEEREYAVSGYGGGPQRACVRVVAYGRAERVRRALVALAAAWGVALASVFIPVAHFVLVPAFLGLGVYRFAIRLGADEVVLAAHGTCPDCHREQVLDVAGRWRVPAFTACRYCQRSLRIGP